MTATVVKVLFLIACVYLFHFIDGKDYGTTVLAIIISNGSQIMLVDCSEN